MHIFVVIYKVINQQAHNMLSVFPKVSAKPNLFLDRFKYGIYNFDA